MVDENLSFSDEVRERLEKLPVALAYLFGSHSEGTSGPLSDVDVGVVFSDPKISQGNTLELYGQLFDLFSELFDTENLDIVFLERATLELRFDVVKYGKALFSISPEFVDNFEHQTVMLYADFKPKLDNFDNAVLQHI